MPNSKHYLHLVVSKSIMFEMNFGKILRAVLALLFGIGADWFTIVWSINNDIPPNVYGHCNPDNYRCHYRRNHLGFEVMITHFACFSSSHQAISIQI